MPIANYIFGKASLVKWIEWERRVSQTMRREERYK